MKCIVFSFLVPVLLTGCSFNWWGREAVPEIKKQEQNSSRSWAIESESSVENENWTSSWVTDSIVTGLLDIEKYGIAHPLIDKKIISNSLNDNSGSEFIGDEKDWRRALSMSCKGIEGKSIKIYSRFTLDLDPVPTLWLERVCSRNSQDSNTLEDLFTHLDTWTKKEFSSLELDISRLKSNLDAYPSHPITPLERIIASQIFYWMSVERFIAARPYKHGILILYAQSQEPGIPYYEITRIYLKDWKLYTKNSPIAGDSEEQFKKLDEKYGKGFSKTLQNNAFHIDNEYSKRENFKFTTDEVKLLRWDWPEKPSIINKKIEERLTVDFKGLN